MIVWVCVWERGGKRGGGEGGCGATRSLFFIVLRLFVYLLRIVASSICVLCFKSNACSCSLRFFATFSKCWLLLLVLLNCWCLSVFHLVLSSLRCFLLLFSSGARLLTASVGDSSALMTTAAPAAAAPNPPAASGGGATSVPYQITPMPQG